MLSGETKISKIVLLELFKNGNLTGEGQHPLQLSKSGRDFIQYSTKLRKKKTTKLRGL
jgi:hypothetical protein